MKKTDIPEQIRKHFFSEETDAVLAKIIKEAGLYNPTSVLGVLFKLFVKDVPAHDFIEALTQEGGLSPIRAKAVARAIKEKLLETERYALFQWGVDISDIKINDAPTLKEIALEEIEEEPAEKKIEVAEIGAEGEETTSIPVTPESPEVRTNEPFILHEEKKTETAAGEKQSILKSISIPLGFFKSRASVQATKPARVEMETPGKSEKRVVNYSELRTSLSPFEGEQNFINVEDTNREQKKELESLPVGAPKIGVPFPLKPEPKPEPPAPTLKTPPPLQPVIKNVDILGTIKKPQPKVEGNTIDLKN